MRGGAVAHRVRDAAGGGVARPAAAGGGARPTPVTPEFAERRLKIKPKETLHFLVQLRAMLAAGVPLLAALHTLRQHATSPAAARAIERIAVVVESGHDLSHALDCLPRCFPKYAVHLLAAGERAGALDESLGRSAELLDKQIKLSGKIKGALAYPGFLLFMTTVMTIGILVLLVPKFEEMLMSRPDQLPATTRLVLAASAFLRESPWLAAAAGAGLLVALVVLLRSRKARGAVFELASRAPILGTLIRKAYVSRSVTTLALTLESGVPILTGLEHAAEVSALPRLQEFWRRAAATVRDGRPLHQAMEGADLPPALVQMVVAGESSGALDSSLRTASAFLDRETQAALEVFTGLLGPATVALAGAVVGFIVVSLMTPILQMAKFVG
ncbi:MAG: type II secretion system F family protein [Planctomycetota bacterium]|nr:MAG: type II secretion system F family protein [Planctomycetota bacterium]